MDYIAKPGRSIGRRVALIAFILAIGWSYVAPILTAYNLISSFLEFTSYIWSCILAVMAGILYGFTARDFRGLAKLCAFLVSIAGLVIIIALCSDSDRMFVYWKLKAIKPAEWQNMIFELQALDKQGRQQSSRVDISREKNYSSGGILEVSLPKVFQPLGLYSDLMGGHAGIGNDPAVFYGVKSRRWGLELGTNDFSHGHWATFIRVQVGSNAWFFAGPDY